MEAATESSVIFKGDIPLSAQRQIVAFSESRLKDVNFARTTGRDLVLTEATVCKRPENRRLQSRLVYQITVGEDSTRYMAAVHTAFLVDVCSPVGLAFLAMVQGRPADFVSQSPPTTPWPLRARLSIMSATTSFVAHTVASRVEIWDVAHGWLYVSGVPNKMAPKLPTVSPSSMPGSSGGGIGRARL